MVACRGTPGETSARMHDARFDTVDAKVVSGIAPAKLNLFLEVLGRRPDGYHELATVFHEIDLADALTVELIDGVGDDELELTGLPIDGDPRQNLVLRAARAFRQQVAPAPRLRIRLDKRVPPGTGMGAGSADAAFVLSALQRLCAPAASPSRLAAAARQVGADVAFFLQGGTAIGRGRGDEVEPFPPPAKPMAFLVALPPLAIATAAAYAHVDLIAPRRAVSSFVEGMRAGAAGNALRGSFNRLESAAIRVEPALGRLLDQLRGTTQRPWVMTGSGSALFAPLADEADEADAADAVRALLPTPACEWRVARSFERHPGSR